MTSDVLQAVVDQLDVWWYGSVTTRMAGLSNDEYWWDPAPGAFGLVGRDGEWFCEWPPGSRGETTPPVTTIGWRVGHIALGCFVDRWHHYLGNGAVDWTLMPFPDNAADALAFLEEWKNKWRDGLVAQGEEFLWTPIGDREGGAAMMRLGHDDPVINVVLHVNREVMHHGAEICLLRDLYRAHNVT